MPNNEDVDLLEQLAEPSKGQITADPTPRPDAPKLPPGVDSAWSLNKRDGARSYYAPADTTVWEPTAPPNATVVEDYEGERERATAAMLGGGIVRRIIDNMAKAANGERVPKAKPSGYCATGGHAVDIAALSHLDRLRYYQDGQCGACRRGEKPKGLAFRLRLPFGRRRRNGPPNP